MCSAAAATTSFPLLPRALPLPWWRCHRYTLNSPISTIVIHGTGSTNPRFRFSATISQSSYEISWLFPDEDPPDYGGWTIVNRPPITTKKAGFPSFTMLDLGVSIAVVLAAASYFAFAGRGFRFPVASELHVLREVLFPSAPEVSQREHGDSDGSEWVGVTSEVMEVDFPGNASGVVKSEICSPRIIPAAVDSTQQEALSALKALKIIEDDVKAGELCSRREYARWLVRENILLERNQNHKIIPSVALSAPVIAAFEDVDTEDPDFEYIQALAEAGIVFNKTSSNYTMEEHGDANFYPDRFISRLDLIDWRAQLEYDFASPGNAGITKSKMDLMDVKEINLETTPGLFMDVVAGDMSLLRRVFGQIRRLQPYIPATKAQAAVALTSGRMARAIHDEFLRIEAEESSRNASKEEIKNEILGQGEIQTFWGEKMELEKRCGLKEQELYITALDQLDLERKCQENAFIEHWKEKSAIDCQKQLLIGLRIEIEEISERLASEGAEIIAEEETLRVVSNNLQVKWEGTHDAKSILEAEIEAARILRSWIEDEASKNQARSKVLEEVGRRWRWDG